MLHLAVPVCKSSIDRDIRWVAKAAEVIFMTSSMKDKVALITGGGSGIGRATALRVARGGVKVMIADYDPDGALKTVAAIKEGGGRADSITADISVTRQVEAIVNKTVETYGRLDYAFNNAGIEGTMADTANYPEDDFDRVIAVNLKAVWLCMKYEIPQMLKNGGGAIVNTASVLGLVGIEQAAAYNAAKHGVVGLTKTAALEFAQKGIRVNCVCPGFIRTKMVERAMDKGAISEEMMVALEPMGRIGRPEEIAEGVCWLLSDAASFVTGHSMAIDGGFVAR
jgi:NAD(P)-dependent dehydrogenase (short-subunit alcohol dehydrogenase family)